MNSPEIYNLWCDHDHDPSMGSLSSIGWDLIRSTDIPNLKHSSTRYENRRGDAKSRKWGSFEVVMALKVSVDSTIRYSAYEFLFPIVTMSIFCTIYEI